MRIERIVLIEGGPDEGVVRGIVSELLKKGKLKNGDDITVKVVGNGNGREGKVKLITDFGGPDLLDKEDLDWRVEP